MVTFDSRLFLFLNGLHTGWLDTVMVSITQMWPWIPLYILLLYMVFKQYGKRGWWILLAVAVQTVVSSLTALLQPRFGRVGTSPEGTSRRTLRIRLLPCGQHFWGSCFFDGDATEKL